MKGKLLIIASFLIIASAVGWSADGGAALYKKNAQLAMAQLAKANRP
jgi:hypothetical protein